MTLLPIRIFPDEVLREKASPVTSFDSALHTLLDDMRETMLDADGIGLAAPQIGVSQRVTVIDISDSRDEGLELINPVIQSKDGKKAGEEGCLSIPGYREKVSRAESLVLEAQNRDGDTFTLEAEGLLAICIQHELDHLDGVLFIDHLSRLKRDMFKRWAKKNLVEEA